MADCGVPISAAAMHAAMAAQAHGDPALAAALEQEALAHGGPHAGAMQVDRWAHDFIVNSHAHVHQQAAMEAHLAAAFEEAAALEHARMAQAGGAAAAQAAWAAEFDAQQREAAAKECPCEWADQLQQAMEATEGEEWAEQFNDATNGVCKTFTVEGEPLLSVEEKNAASAFHGFMAKLNAGEIEIVEPEKLVKERPDGVVTTGDDDMAAEFINEAALRAARGEDGTTAADLLGDDEDDEEAAENAWADADPDKWAAEFEARRAAAEEDGEHFAQQFHDGVGGETGDDWLNEYKEMQAKMQAALDSSEYPFEENNPFLFHDNLMAEARDLIAAGTLSEAVLALEALCQKESSNAAAWHLLGTTQAENEKDGLAIRALNMARKLDPTRLDVYQSLAVSHTNEANFTQAMQAMRAWVVNHPEYRTLEHVVSSRPQPSEQELAELSEDGGFSMEFLAINPTEHRQVCTLYEAALEMNPTDIEAVVGLGVLRHLAHQYDEAAAQFRRAVDLRPTDAKLWNKLGATLANGNRSREAIDAYQRALDINPGFVRVRYNLGIAFSNLGENHMAATQFLKAIAMQQGSLEGGGNGAASGEGDCPATRSTREIWDTLRMTFNVMERTDLVQLSWKMDFRAFESEFGLEAF